MLTTKQVSLVEDLIKCQRALEKAERPSDEVTPAHLGLEKIANKHGFNHNTTNMCDIVDYLLSMLAEENSHEDR